MSGGGGDISSNKAGYLATTCLVFVPKPNQSISVVTRDNSTSTNVDLQHKETFGLNVFLVLQKRT